MWSACFHTITVASRGMCRIWRRKLLNENVVSLLRVGSAVWSSQQNTNTWSHTHFQSWKLTLKRALVCKNNYRWLEKKKQNKFKISTWVTLVCRFHCAHIWKTAFGLSIFIRVGPANSVSDAQKQGWRIHSSTVLPQLSCTQWLKSKVRVVIRGTQQHLEF